MAKVLTGDETGLLKVVSLRKKEILCNWGEQTRDHGIQALSWVSTDGHSSYSSSAYCATVNKSGHLEVWDTLTGNRIHCIQNVGCDNTILLTMYKGNFVVCGANSARLIPQDCTDVEELSPEKEIVFASSISAAAVHHDSGLLAVGGKDHELTLYNIETLEEVWKAKNVPLNKLDRRVPVWVTGIAFLPEPDVTAEQSKDIVLSQHMIGIVTGYRHVRIYDTRISQQPIRNVDEAGPRHFTACALSNDGKSLIVGDTTGSLYRVAIDTLKVTGAYKGCVGSIRSIAVHPRLPYFAAAGLDRHVRIYNTESRQLIRRLYMKQRLNCVTFVPSNTAETSLIPEGLHPKAGGKAHALKLREITERRREGKVDPIIELEEELDKERQEGDMDDAVWEKLEARERANKSVSEPRAGKKRKLEEEDSDDDEDEDDDVISDFESDSDEEDYGLFDSDDSEEAGDDEDDDEDTALVDSRKVAWDLRKEVKDSQRQQQRGRANKRATPSKRK